MAYYNITKVTTNNIEGSVMTVTIKKVTFKELWDAYPSNSIEHINPKTEEDEFGNHCAINVSDALYKCDIKLKSFTGAKCWHKCSSSKNIHVIRAQELADWLKKQPFAGCPKPIKLTGATYEDAIDGKTGIVFFKDYWQRNSEKGTDNRTGDHVDLWDGKGVNQMASQNAVENLITNTFGVHWDGVYSDKGKSKEVLFWEIN